MCVSEVYGRWWMQCCRLYTCSLCFLPVYSCFHLDLAMLSLGERLLCHGVYTRRLADTFQVIVVDMMASDAKLDVAAQSELIGRPRGRLHSMSDFRARSHIKGLVGAFPVKHFSRSFKISRVMRERKLSSGRRDGHH